MARRAVAEALQGIAVDRDAIGVVVSEAVTNAVVHAYRDRDATGNVHVSATLDDEAVEIGVADDGTGMRPRVDSPGVGLGVAADGAISPTSSRSTERGGGTRIAARFALMGAAGPHGRPLARQMAGRAERRTAALL